MDPEGREGGRRGGGSGIRIGRGKLSEEGEEEGPETGRDCGDELQHTRWAEQGAIVGGKGTQPRQRRHCCDPGGEHIGPQICFEEGVRVFHPGHGGRHGQLRWGRVVGEGERPVLGRGGKAMGPKCDLVGDSGGEETEA